MRNYSLVLDRGGHFFMLSFGSALKLFYAGLRFSRIDTQREMRGLGMGPVLRFEDDVQLSWK